MVDFLRALQPQKQENNVFNFDFIAFGKFNQTKKGNTQLWTSSAFSFFEDFVNAHFADSFSLYTLEFSEHQRRSREKKSDLLSRGCFGTEEDIYEEFDRLKTVLLEAGYARYEISNFALIAKSSIHNRVYREMEEYLGLGLGASSLVQSPL
jgi:coproporphyrinogen III oxidase-like Fe-S oxidoreductase